MLPPPATVDPDVIFQSEQARMPGCLMLPAPWGPKHLPLIPVFRLLPNITTLTLTVCVGMNKYQGDFGIYHKCTNIIIFADQAKQGAVL